MPNKKIEWGNIPVKGLEDNDLSKYSIKSLVAKENAINSSHIISAKAKERWGDDVLRFFSNIQKKGENDCWITNKKEILLKDGRRISYQRFSLEIIGKKSKKECVVHKCNNKKCVNPNHLFYASRSEQTSISPKFSPKGEKNINAKLKSSDIPLIKKEYKQLVKKLNKTYGVATILSKKYNVTSATIGNIIKEKNWK